MISLSSEIDWTIPASRDTTESSDLEADISLEPEVQRLDVVWVGDERKISGRSPTGGAVAVGGA